MANKVPSNEQWTDLVSKIKAKANTSSLATVATSGSYNDLSNKPTIPAAITVDSALSSSSTNPVQNRLITEALNGKLDGFTMNFYGQWSGGPHAVKFCEVDYSTANSENGIFIKMSMVNSHGNGEAGRFLQDVILNVKYTGVVAAMLYRYFSTQIVSSGSPYHLVNDYGDVFWTIDTTNKIVKFFVLMHQFSRTFMSPYFRLNVSTGGIITQSSSGNSEEYSTGTQNWATAYNYTDIRPVDTALSSTSTNPVQNKIINTALNAKADASSLAAVATSGSYNDLADKPTIPQAVTVDSALSSTSTNPVQNKVIYAAIGDVETALQTLNSGSGV